MIRVLAVLCALAMLAGTAAAADPVPSADRALARRLTLHPADLPSGWTAESVPKSSSTCKATRWFRSVETARIQTAYGKGAGHISSTAAVFPTAKTSKKAFADYANNFRSCALQIPLSKLTVKTIVLAGVGDEAKAWAVRGSVQGTRIAFDIYLARIGRADALYEFGGVGTRPPLADAALVRKATARA